MANLIRRGNDQPQRELATQQTAWEPLRLMRELMSWDPFAEMLPSLSTESMVFTPRFEVKETKDAYVFKADLPGIEDKDVDISLTGNRLTVSGKREAEERNENDRFYAYERSYGSFSRSFTLPDGADVEHADADMKNGVLMGHDGASAATVSDVHAGGSRRAIPRQVRRQRRWRARRGAAARWRRRQLTVGRRGPCRRRSR